MPSKRGFTGGDILSIIEYSVNFQKKTIIWYSVFSLYHGITKYGLHSLTQIVLAMDKELTNTVWLISWLVTQTGMTDKHPDISH